MGYIRAPIPKHLVELFPTPTSDSEIRVFLSAMLGETDKRINSKVEAKVASLFTKITCTSSNAPGLVAEFQEEYLQWKLARDAAIKTATDPKPHLREGETRLVQPAQKAVDSIDKTVELLGELRAAAVKAGSVSETADNYTVPKITPKEIDEIIADRKKLVNTANAAIAELEVLSTWLQAIRLMDCPADNTA